jgi:hypothetical protein
MSRTIAINMKNVILIVSMILVSLGSFSQVTTIVPDGVQHQFITAQAITSDKTYDLSTGGITGVWSISIPLTVSKADSCIIKIKALTGNKWIDYALDSCIVTSTTWTCSWEDDRMAFDKIRVSIDLIHGATATVNGYYRFVRTNSQ